MRAQQRYCSGLGFGFIVFALLSRGSRAACVAALPCAHLFTYGNGIGRVYSFRQSCRRIYRLWLTVGHDHNRISRAHILGTVIPCPSNAHRNIGILAHACSS
jgi:hypothetical protein